MTKPASRSRRLPQEVTVRVPGSTSNCGAGFDSLGMALSIYNEITLTRGDWRGARPAAASDTHGLDMADEAAGRGYLTLTQGFADTAQRWVVSHHWDHWRSEVLWMTAYFSAAVWISLTLVLAPRWAPLPADGRALIRSDARPG